LLAASEWKSRFSISDGSLLWLWAHLKRHRPARILEMGSGISTLAFSFYASSYKSAASERSCVVSLEHDEKWVATTDKRLQEMNTRQFVTLLHCALGPVPVGGIEQSSYSVDCGRISELFGGKGPDLVLIDGPPGDVGRLATLPSILPLLTQRTEVFLDDAYRPGEQAIIARWQNTMSACLRYCGTFPLGNGLAYFVYHPKIRNGAPRT
jgi:predicted O-methyltransferase YrrM